MKKNFGMSNLGYAIILVIIIAIVMILSTPMIVNNVKNKNLSDNSEERKDYQSNSYDRNSDKYEKDAYVGDKYKYADGAKINVSEYIMELESRLNARIDNVEMRQNELLKNAENKSDVKDAYICSIEGFLDSDNNVVPLDSPQASSDLKSQKFVFVCQYK